MEWTERAGTHRFRGILNFGACVVAPIVAGTAGTPASAQDSGADHALTAGPRAGVGYALALLLSVVFALLRPAPATADYRYTYTGNPFTDFFPGGQCAGGVGECMLSGYFTVPTPIPPNIVPNTGNAIDVGCQVTDFFFTDGVHVITLDNLQRTCPGGGGLGILGTDANGQITSWAFQLGTNLDTACPACNSLASLNFSGPGVGQNELDVTSGWGVASCNGCELADNTNSPGTWTSAPVVFVDPSLFDGPRNPALSKHCDCDDFGATNVWAGDPVNALTGNLTVEVHDLAIPGRGRNLEIDRTYDALDAASATAPGPFGYGWHYSYGDSLVADTNTGQVKIVQEGGATVTFQKGSNGSFTAPPYVTATLTQSSNGNYLFVLQNQLSDTFTSDGLLISETDRNGYTTQLEHGTFGLAFAVDPAGRQLTFSNNNPNRFITNITDPAGRAVSYSYDTNENLVSVTDVAKGVTTYTYDAHHRLLSTTDPRGNKVTNVYDSANRVVSQTDALGRTTTWAYSASISSSNGNGTTTITDPNGHVTIRQFTNYLLSALTIGADGGAPSTWSYNHDAGFNQTSMTDPEGKVWSMTYDSRSNLLSRTDPLGRTASATYDSANDQITATDPLGATTTTTYDSHGNVTSVSRALSGTSKSATTTYTYGDPAHPGDVTAVTDPDGNLSQIAYDKYGDIVQRTDPAGDKSTFAYNNVGFLTSSVRAKGYAKGGKPTQYRTVYAYDGFGDLTQVTDPLGHVTRQTYDANRNLVGAIDANGNATSYSYDADNERVGEKRADGTTLATAYDGAGNMTSQTDPLGHKTQYSFDEKNRLVRVTDALGRVTTFAYDSTGNRISRTDPSGRNTSYGYDAADQLISINYSDGVTPGVSFTYDADGQRVSMADGTGTTRYAYDSLGRLTNSVDGAGAGISYSYDLSGRVTSITYPNKNSVVRTYDPAGRLTSVVDWIGNSTTFAYDADGNLTRETYPNTWQGTFSYDRDDSMLGAAYARGKRKLTFKLVRNKLELVVREGVSASLGSTILFPTRNYKYDALNRLITDTATSGSYVYDANDRITALSGATAAYDNGDELAAIGGAGASTFGYDAQGNRIADGTATLAYDQENRLVSYGANASYRYNGDGLRTSKTIGSATEQFNWDRVAGGPPLLIADGNTYYVYGPRNRLIEQIGGSGGPLFYHQDQIGSTRMLTDSSGKVAGTYSFDAYGNQIGVTGSAANPFLYAGQYTDAESGFEYLRARYYDAASAQFVGVDPSAPSTRERYAYSKDNPANLIDPAGTDPAPASTGAPQQAPITVEIRQSMDMSSGAFDGADCGCGKTGVSYLRAGSSRWQGGYYGVQLRPGDRFKTSDDTILAVNLSNGGVMGINKGQEYVVNADGSIQNVTEANGLQTTVFQTGTMWAKFRKPDCPVRINPNSKTMSIKG